MASFKRFTKIFGLATIAGIGIAQSQRPRDASMAFGMFSSADNKSVSDSGLRTETIVWGNGQATDKSEYLGIYPVFTPTKLESLDGGVFPSLVKVFTADGVQGGVDGKGDLYAWPSYSVYSMVDDDLTGQLGQRRGAKKIGSGVRKAVYCNQGIWILYQNGDVGRVQVNMKRNRDSLPVKTYIADKVEMMNRGRSLIDLTAGDDHIVALDKDGLAYCYGDDTLGQCGQGSKGRTTYGPYKETRNDDFKKVTGSF